MYNRALRYINTQRSLVYIYEFKCFTLQSYSHIHVTFLDIFGHIRQAHVRVFTPQSDVESCFKVGFVQTRECLPPVCRLELSGHQVAEDGDVRRYYALL